MLAQLLTTSEAFWLLLSNAKGCLSFGYQQCKKVTESGSSPRSSLTALLKAAAAAAAAVERGKCRHSE